MSHYPLEPSGPVFQASFAATALTTNPQDMFCLLAPSNSRVAVREIRLGQFTEFGDAQAELISLSILTGSTISTTSVAITPRNVLGHSGAPTAGSSVNGPSSGLASTASAVLRLADSWNVAGGFYYKPDAFERIILNPSQRFLLRMTAPNDALTLNGTLTFQEIGNAASTST